MLGEMLIAMRLKRKICKTEKIACYSSQSRFHRSRTSHTTRRQKTMLATISGRYDDKHNGFLVLIGVALASCSPRMRPAASLPPPQINDVLLY